MRHSVSVSTGSAGLDVAQPALGDVHELAVARDHGQEAGQLALVHVALVVAVDAGQACGVEAGFGGVDLDGWSTSGSLTVRAPSFHQARLV